MNLKIKLGYFILFVQLIVVFLAEFLTRFLAFSSHLIQLSFSLLFIALFIFYFNKKLKIGTIQIILLILTVLSLGIIRNQFFLNLFQLILVCSNFVFVFFSDKIDKTTAKNLMWLIVLFCVLQLAFDLIFPKNTIDPNDQFSGTFIMANNKSRFLFYILPFLFYLNKNRYSFKRGGKIVTISAVLYSAYLGYSNLGVLLILISVIMGVFFKNIYKVIITLLIGLYVVFLITDYQVRNDKSKEYSTLEMNYERFFDDEIGVAAVYKYGFKKLKESWFLGVGYGNFSSRSGQFFKSDITENIPKQMIKKWSPLFTTKAPYGLSSLYVLLVELGVMALIPIFLLFKWLNTFVKNSKVHIRIMAIYLIVIINYNPTFFEYNESILYILTLILVHKLLPIDEEKNTNPVT